MSEINRIVIPNEKNALNRYDSNGIKIANYVTDFTDVVDITTHHQFDKETWFEIVSLEELNRVFDTAERMLLNHCPNCENGILEKQMKHKGTGTYFDISLINIKEEYMYTDPIYVCAGCNITLLPVEDTNNERSNNS